MLLQAWRELDQQQWQPCSWQQLDMELSAAARRNRPTQAWQVQLRLPVRHLQQLWTLRLQVRMVCWATDGQQTGRVCMRDICTTYCRLAAECDGFSHELCGSVLFLFPGEGPLSVPYIYGTLAGPCAGSRARHTCAQA
jgi:hypothetical protein